MNDKRIGKRFKEARERLGLTQEEFAEKADFTKNYISRIERGVSFPRYDKLIKLLNALEISADAIFCDVLLCSNDYKSSQLSAMLADLSPISQKRILQTLEVIIQQEDDA